MRHLERPADLGDLAQAAEDLRTLSARITVALVDGDRFQIAHRGQLRLRCLQVHEVRDPGLVVEPVGWRHLSGARQRRQRVVGDVGFRQPCAEREGAMRGDQQRRLRQRLLDRRVRDAGDAAHLGDHALGVGHVRCDVAPDDLHVDAVPAGQSSGSSP